MTRVNKVFGIGLNKTGTTSLRQALVHLGFPYERMHGRLTRLYFKGEIEEIFRRTEHLGAFEDWPWPLMYKEIFERYGDSARYVLTRRASAERWIDSLKAHSLRTPPDNNPRSRIFGYAYPHGVENRFSAFYEAHLNDVRAYFTAQGADHLLLEVCWEEGDGWPELCGFLDLQVPDRKAFPHANRRAEATAESPHRSENQRRIAAQIAELSR